MGKQSSGKSYWFLVTFVVMSFMASDIAFGASNAELEQKIQKLDQRLSEVEKTPGKGSSQGGKDTFRMYWNNGIRFDTPDKAFKLKLGGRFQNDWAFFLSQDQDVTEEIGEDMEDGTEMRRARLYIAGQLYDRVIFKTQYEFAGGAAQLKDAYIGLNKLPFLGTVKIGHFNETFGLEELTSDNYITFIERANTTTFTPQRNTGIMFQNHILDDRMTWAVGLYREADNFGKGTSDEEANLTGRVTGLPLYTDDGEMLLHLGCSYSHKFLDGSEPYSGTIRYKAKPETHLAENLVDTGTLSAESVDLIDGEFAFVFNNVSLQGEYIHTTVQEADFGNRPDFNAYYGMVSVFLTGERRPYSKSGGVFGRVKPNKNFLAEGGGIGALELAARYSQVDLDDTFAGVDGGTLRDFTVGLNWYLNPNVRVALNYVNADLDKVGDVDIFQTRFQVDF